MRSFNDLAGYFASQIYTAEAEASRVYEPMIGIVTDNKDPDKLGRVKVKIPTLSEHDTTWWCPIVMMGAGKNRGWFFIPEKDDEVLVLFEHGDINCPVVVGSLWNGKDKPPDKNPSGNPRRVIRSRAGSKITFDDETNKLTVEDGGGKGKITLDADANKVIIEALSGDVCFQTPAGETKIVAKSIDIKAGQNLEIHSGKAMNWGASTATINGSGGVTLSGSKVNLNCGNAQSPEKPDANPQDIPDPYEARGNTEQAASAPATASSSPPPSAPPAPSPAPATSSGTRALDVPPLEPKPLLLMAQWEKARVPAGAQVKLQALAVDMAGKSATFAIHEAVSGRAVTSVTGTCGDDRVEATWTTPSSGDASEFTFEATAEGQTTESGLLVVTQPVEVKLMLDEEAADGVKVRLRSDPTGEILNGTADASGVVRFDAPLGGEYTVLLDEEA